MDPIMWIFICVVAGLHLWALTDIVIRALKGQHRTMRWFWIIIIIPIAGPVLYFALKNKPKDKQQA